MDLIGSLCSPVCRHVCLRHREGRGEPGSPASPETKPPAWRPVQSPTRLGPASGYKDNCQIV